MATVLKATLAPQLPVPALYVCDTIGGRELDLVLAAADPCSPASRRGAAAGTVSRQDHPAHATGGALL